MYDLIVIGAGPAGCIAAKKANDAGYEVLLVERMEIPREKSCSGIIIQKSANILEREFGKIPRSVLCKPNISKGLIITNEENQQFKFRSDSFNVWRSLFDYWMASKAQDNGVEFRDSTSAISCNEEQKYVSVKLREKESYYEKAKAVIVCNGASSNIKRNLLETNSNYIFTYQTFCKGAIDLDNEYFYAFLHPYLSQYDAWFNVKDDFLIFGVGVKETGDMKIFHSKFISFLRSNFNLKIDSILKKEVGIMPSIKPGCPVDLGKGRILFAGETANFLNPIGEGISSALLTGLNAAESLDYAYDFIDSDPQILLDTYKNKTKNEKDYMIRQWDLLANISSKFDYMKK